MYDEGIKMHGKVMEIEVDWHYPVRVIFSELVRNELIRSYTYEGVYHEGSNPSPTLRHADPQPNPTQREKDVKHLGFIYSHLEKEHGSPESCESMQKLKSIIERMAAK